MSNKNQQNRNIFKMSAHNSLRMVQVRPQNENNLLQTFKGNQNLREQLNRSKPMKKNDLKITHKRQKIQHNNRVETNDALEVAALDNFKITIRREQTQQMILGINLRRRQKHLNTYKEYQDNFNDSIEDMTNTYVSLVTNFQYLLKIDEQNIDKYFKNMTNQYLISYQKDIINKIDIDIEVITSSIIGKINHIKQELSEIKSHFQNRVQEDSIELRNKLIDIAFILEPQAKQIQKQERKKILKIQQEQYEKHKKNINIIQEEQKKKIELISQQKQVMKQQWRKVKEADQIDQYVKKMNLQQLRNPKERKQLYLKLISVQQKYHLRKKKLLENLIKQHPDCLVRSNIDKWFDGIKNINEQFGLELDQLTKKLMKEYEKSKQKNQSSLEYLTERLKYVQNHNEEEINELIKQNYKQLKDRNNQEAQELMKKAINYVENCDSRENDVLQQVKAFISAIANCNDEFHKQFSIESQKYELQRAKIFDEDDDKIEKMTQQLVNLKQQLRQSVHHIKLDQMKIICFTKIDEIQSTYRETYNQNKQLVAHHPQTLSKFLQQYQSRIAQVFQLYQPSKKNELIQKNKKIAQDQAMKIIEEQDQKKVEEENKNIQQIKKKGGKVPPPAKPNDPKKLALQIQERKKVILANIGIKSIEQLQSKTGTTWLIFRSMEEICADFYKIIPQNEEKEKIKSKQDIQKEIKENKKIAIDELQQPIKDYQNNKVVTNKSFIIIKQLSIQLEILRDKIFTNISQKKQQIILQSTTYDNNIISEQLAILDNRLKKHYSLKGKLQSQIYVKRSGEITNHKKKYQKHIRIIKQRMDLQTQKFNYLLQNSLDYIKKHNNQQKKSKEQLSNCKNISQMQGLLNKVKDSFNGFRIGVKEIVFKLQKLHGQEIDSLLKKNDIFIKQCKLIGEGGQYSSEQIQWYQSMIKQIIQQLQQQKSKRRIKIDEMDQYMGNRSKQLLEIFQKQYSSEIEELAVRNGTGKKYGKPKRMAQEKIRLQMNKCQEAQIKISKQIQNIEEIYHKQKNKMFLSENKPFTLEWRKKIMTVQSCIRRYAKHIQALVPNLKASSMMRVNYDQSLPQCILPVEQEQQDKKRVLEQLHAIGALYQQKDERTFIRYIEQIEKLISEQARSIYSGDKAKYLIGTDKIPDFLRTYIQTMRKNAQQFRMNSISQLRDSCQKLSNLASYISQMFFMSIYNYYQHKQNTNKDIVQKQFEILISKHQQIKQKYLFNLRPNLQNPKCQEQLINLNKNEQQRSNKLESQIIQLRQNFWTEHFKTGSQMLSITLNNYDMLMNYMQSLLLHEDFIHVIGEQQNQKSHLSIQRLLIIKQKGTHFDAQSQRNLRKTWNAIHFDLFNINEMKFQYKRNVQPKEKQKDKKAGKKDTKDNKKVQENIEGNTTKSIQTYKTWRQKSVFTKRQQVLNKYKESFNEIKINLEALFDQCLKKNESFKLKWQTMKKQLLL